MKILNISLAAFMAIFALSCSSQHFILKENWIDERDVMALRDMPIEQWVTKAGRPTLVEIVGDTNVYYYNYRPTMYVVGVHQEDNVKESKPGLEHATEIWGSRRDLMQIKIVNNLVVQAIVINGPDAKTFVRDLNGNLVLNPNSGYVSNISQDIKVHGEVLSNANKTIQAAPAIPVATQAAPVAQANDFEPWLPVPAEAAPTPAPVHTPAHAPTHAAEAAHEAAPAHVAPAHAEPPTEAH
ncbi:MAG: hypothetical protein FWC15_07800 [Fibromonadales bacterium]|nr:hypothetical protein [Fibromonadales bacterium]